MACVYVVTLTIYLIGSRSHWSKQNDLLSLPAICDVSHAVLMLGQRGWNYSQHWVYILSLLNTCMCALFGVVLALGQWFCSPVVISFNNREH